MFFAFSSLIDISIQNILLCIGLCLILPMILLSFYLEKRARRIIISMICGVIASISAFYINQFVTSSFNFNDIVIYSIMGPIVEETLKFIPVAVIAIVVKKGRRGSAANAFAVGVGFSVMENFCYLISSLSTVSIGWIVLRCIGTGLMHSMSTTIMGMGLYFAINKEHGKFLNVVGTWIVAIVFHGVFNFMVQNEILNVFAVLLPIIVFILFFIILKKKELHNFLWDIN